MKQFKKLCFTLYFFLCLANIYIWPTNKYEWMLADEPNMPLPVDDNSILYAGLSGSPILALLIFLVGANSRSFNLTCILSTLLLSVLWCFKFQSVIF